MDTLLLNTRIVLKQATGIQIKNLVSILLTTCSLSGPDEQKGCKQPTGIQKSSEQNAHYLLTISLSSFM